MSRFITPFVNKIYSFEKKKTEKKSNQASMHI